VIQGPWLMEQMQKQAAHVGTKIVTDHVNAVALGRRPFRLTCDSGDVYLADSLILATGAQARWLDLPSEQKFRGYGVSACATCDGFFYRGREVLVIGGGNTAVEEALFLTNFASKVTIVHRRDSFRASVIMQDRALKNPKIKPVWNSIVTDILDVAQNKVTGVKLKNITTGETSTIDCAGVFVAIGHVPNTAVFGGALDLEANGTIKLHGGQQTNVPGVFAAGDVADSVYRQAITAAGTGCAAAIEAERYLGVHAENY